MKQILLFCSLSFLFVFNTTAQNMGDLNSKEVKAMFEKGMRIGNKYMKENASNIRTGEPILLDSIAEDFLDLESMVFEESVKYAFIFEEVEGKFRYDSIIFKVDLTGSPIPIQGLSGKVNYNDEGRFSGFRIIARTALFSLDFLEYIIRYDANGKVILNKIIPNPLLGDVISGDSIVYNYDGNGLVSSWVKYDLELHTSASEYSESYTDISYDNEGIMTGYTHTTTISGEASRERFSDVLFYQPASDLADALLDTDANIELFVYPINEFNPLNEMRTLQVNNNREIWVDNDWVLFTSRTHEYKGDTLVTYTEEQPNIFIEIEEYAFNAQGQLLSRTIIVDAIVVPLTPEFRTLYSYNANGDVLNLSSQFFAEGRWEENYREEYEYEYDDNDLISEMRIFLYIDDELVFGERYRIWNREETTVSSFENRGVAFEVAMYPNPVVSDSNLQIKGLDGETVQIMLTDLTGRAIIQQKLTIVGDEMNQSLQFSDVPAGYYVLVVAHPSGRVAIPMIKM